MLRKRRKIVRRDTTEHAESATTGQVAAKQSLELQNALCSILSIPVECRQTASAAANGCQNAGY